MHASDAAGREVNDHPGMSLNWRRLVREGSTGLVLALPAGVLTPLSPIPAPATRMRPYLLGVLRA
jgi:hypothetical protein